MCELNHLRHRKVEHEKGGEFGAEVALRFLISLGLAWISLLCETHSCE